MIFFVNLSNYILYLLIKLTYYISFKHQARAEYFDFLQLHVKGTHVSSNHCHVVILLFMAESIACGHNLLEGLKHRLFVVSSENMLHSHRNTIIPMYLMLF